MSTQYGQHEVTNQDLANVAAIAAGVATQHWVEGDPPRYVCGTPEEVAKVAWWIYDEIISIQEARLAASRKDGGDR